MATLSYQVTYGDWSGTINLNYDITYDPATNKSTITFGQCSAVYSSRADYQTTTDTNITIKAGDNTDSSVTATLKTSGYGTGGTVTFTGTPSPASLVVQHSAGAGAKTVTISGSTTAAVRPYSGSSLVYAGGSGSTTVTSTTLFTLTKSAGSGSTITVDNTTTGETNLASGALIAAGSSLKITFGVSTGYELGTHTVNGSTFASGNIHTVAGNVSVVATAARKSYTLTLTTDGHCALTVERSGTALSNGATIYHGDVLTVTFAPVSGYKLKTATLNGGAITSPAAHTVTGAVAIIIATSPLGFVYRDNGTEIVACEVYRDTGTEIVRCRFYRDNGTEIVPC